MSLAETKAVWERINERNAAVLDQAQELADELHSALLKRLGIELKLHSAREQMQEMEHQALLGGEIDGRNAETRAAQLAQLLKRDEHYVALQQLLLEGKSQVGQLDAEIEYLRQKLSLAKLAARWNVAIAAAWGGSDDD